MSTLTTDQMSRSHTLQENRSYHIAQPHVGRAPTPMRRHVCVTAPSSWPTYYSCERAKCGNSSLFGHCACVDLMAFFKIPLETRQHLTHV